MRLNWIEIPLLGLVPVLLFLLALVRLDSYKLTGLRTVLGVLAAGAACGLAAYGSNGLLLDVTGMRLSTYAATLAPIVEELLKGMVVLWLFRTHRIGMPIDAAILGFAVGAGFAVVENAFYMMHMPDAALATWLVRGLGTAMMHGAVTAILSVISVVAAESHARWGWLRYLPGLVVAVGLHAAFNQPILSPTASAVVTVLALPILLFEIFQYGQRRISQWLGTGFDADADLLALLESGRLKGSALGNYLETLMQRFEGEAMADILCYVRVHTELALRAKGLLMMRENGMDLPMDDETRAKFTELEYLEGSIGTTGLLAIRPMLHASRKDLWQLNVLGK